ncbi:MAG: ferredoxin [Desulfobacterales bacterium]|nr:MAG: ferredoxin [Desulfobacterales bacterium]
MTVKHPLTQMPVVDLSECIRCGICTEVCPQAFQMNAAGYIEVVELTAYPEPEVNEAIKYCPVHCIDWE